MEHFFTIGYDNLNEHLFWEIDEPAFGNPFKPYGGLWLTKYNTNYYNDWADYLGSHPYILTFHYEHPTRLPASLVTLKPDAKIFNFTSKKDLEFLQNKYPATSFPFSYVALSKDYDGIFFDLSNAFHDHSFSVDEDKQLWGLGVNSLVLFNLNSILYYQKALVDYTQINFDDPRDELSYTIHIDDEQRSISKDNPYEEFITALCVKTKAYFLENGIDFTLLSTYDLSAMIVDILRNHLAQDVQELTASSQLNERQIIRMLTKKVHELKLP